MAILSCRVILNRPQIRIGFPRLLSLYSLWNLILCPYVGYRPGPAEYFGTFSHWQSCDATVGQTLWNYGMDRSRWRTGSGVPSSRCILTQMSDWIIETPVMHFWPAGTKGEWSKPTGRTEPYSLWTVMTSLISANHSGISTQSGVDQVRKKKCLWWMT